MPELYNNKADLIQKYLANTISEQEQKELDQWLSQSEENRLLFYKLQSEEFVFNELKTFDNIVSSQEAVKQKLLNQVKSAAVQMQTGLRKKRIWWTYVAAAVLIVGVSAGVYSYLNKPVVKQVAVVTPVTPKSSLQNEPNNSYKAVLTLADGTAITLNERPDGLLADQGLTAVVKEKGNLNYQVKSEKGEKDQSAISYNTVSTPKGGQYRVSLPDGSKVWLNAASSLRFPIAFAGHERIIELTGEAYFEVAKTIKTSADNTEGEKIPFIIRANGSEVKVLGTHFNVMAYNNEPSLLTTLLEGAVEVKKGATVQRLVPGQQAGISNGTGRIKVVKVQDAENSIAWKNGNFSFQDTDFPTVMRQIERWYDVDIHFSGNASKTNIRFTGKLSRDKGINYIFKILESYDVKASINGREITVTL